MEKEPVNVIRETTRNLLKLNRQHQRDEVNDLNRSISEIRITPEKISNIAQNLKSKSCITAVDLNILKNGLMDDPNHKNIVLGTQGALRGLVRELTGNDTSKQCAAGGCLCNLALAEGKSCNTIAKASGCYLVMLMDSPTMELVVTCAWTVGNLAGSGPRECELLLSQGALGKLCDLLQHCEQEAQDAALYALVHFTYQLKDQLRVDRLKRILQELTKMQLTMSSCQLLFILSCHTHFLENVTEELQQRILADLPSAMETHSSTCKSDAGSLFCCRLVHVIRILSNMDISKIYEFLINILVRSNVTVTIHRILSVSGKSVLRDSLLWLLGNLYNFNSDNVFFYNVLQNVNIKQN